MKTCYIFGDSLLRGVMPDENGLYHSSEAIGFEKIGKRCGVRIVNYAMPTFTSERGLAWMEQVMSRCNEKPDLAFVEFGGNDCDYNWKQLMDKTVTLDKKHRVSPEDFQDNYEKMLRLLVTQGIRVVVPVLMPQIPCRIYFKRLEENGVDPALIRACVPTEEDMAREYEEYREIIRKLAQTACPHPLELLDISPVFEEMDRDTLEAHYSVDGMHPNEKGYARMGEAFEEFFEKILK